MLFLIIVGGLTLSLVICMAAGRLLGFNDNLCESDSPITALLEVREFSEKNPGYGYSCGKIADKFLREHYDQN